MKASNNKEEEPHFVKRDKFAGRSYEKSVIYWK